MGGSERGRFGPVSRREIRAAQCVALAALLIVTAARSAAADRRWAAEIHLGGAWNLSLPLVIRQGGEEELRFDARWHTRPFEPPIYYVARLATRDGRRGWALDLTHHKIHLANPPVEVASFSVSHGYNLLMLHRLMERGARRLGVGAGMVIAHPESRVRGRPLDEHGGPLGGGYYPTGPALGALAAWLPARRAGLYPSAEARLTLARARVPVEGGHARVPNVALHVTVGLGWEGGR